MSSWVWLHCRRLVETVFAPIAAVRCGGRGEMNVIERVQVVHIKDYVEQPHARRTGVFGLSGVLLVDTSGSMGELWTVERAAKAAFCGLDAHARIALAENHGAAAYSMLLLLFSTRDRRPLYGLPGPGHPDQAIRSQVNQHSTRSFVLPAAAFARSVVKLFFFSRAAAHGTLTRKQEYGFVICRSMVLT